MAKSRAAKRRARKEQRARERDKQYRIQTAKVAAEREEQQRQLLESPAQPEPRAVRVILSEPVEVGDKTPDELFEAVFVDQPRREAEELAQREQDLHRARIDTALRQLIADLEDAGIVFTVGEAQKIELPLGDQWWQMWLQVEED